MSHTEFQLIRRSPIASLNLDVQEYLHPRTGARHFHFRSDDDNNAFLVAFMTVPEDSTGVAHILEHTSLCGSERYPVRDPFFMMIRRSLNTFMNAFTSSDWTAYPFATQNRKDFYNLLQVYLDAVFFPRLGELDFAQEGHRLEFQVPDDPTTPLEYRGVVFNEMKGAMSSPVSQLWQNLQAQVFPTITYHNNSGGDPQIIPELTYAQLKAFHARHYHPTNAVFMTYGNLPVTGHHERFEELALDRFQRRGEALSVGDERRYEQPVAVDGVYTIEEGEPTQRKTHVVVAWLLGKTASLEDLMRAHLLNGVLLDNSSSPLRRALETTELGTAPSEVCGLDDSTREMSFVAGLEGSDPERSEATEELVLRVLEEVATQGVPLAQVESVLHQLELQQREIQSGAFPYGLRLMVNTLGPTLHGGDPVAILDIDPVLDRLRAECADPEFVKGLVREWLLDNPHRIRLTLIPDPSLSERREASERARLDRLAETFDEVRRQQVVDLAARLKERQLAGDDPEILPKVGLEDVPAELQIASGEQTSVAGRACAWFAQGTNGMVYQQLVVDLPKLDAGLVDVMPLFTDCVTEVGSGGRDYLDTQALQAAVTGGIGARYSVAGAVDDSDRAKGYLALSGKALVRNHGALGDLLAETYETARFDETTRLRELISEQRLQRETAVTGHGHALAMLAACSGMSPVSALAHAWDGLLGLQRLKALDDSLAEREVLADLADRLERIARAFELAPGQLLAIGETAHRDEILGRIEAAWANRRRSDATHTPMEMPTARGQVREAWLTSTQVSFCAKAYPSVAQRHPDAASLTVLGGFLRNGYLHRAIREQGGAYGAGASYDADSGAFRFFSYRDPRLTETLADFDRALDWLQTHRHPQRTLEEAVLGVVSSIDRPSSPSGEAVRAFFSGLHGRTPELRRDFRRRVLTVTLGDLRRVGEVYLRPELANVAVLTHTAALEESGLDLAVNRV